MENADTTAAIPAPCPLTEHWAIFNDNEIQRDDTTGVFVSDDGVRAHIRSCPACLVELAAQAAACDPPRAPSMLLANLYRPGWVVVGAPVAKNSPPDLWTGKRLYLVRCEGADCLLDDSETGEGAVWIHAQRLGCAS